MREITKRSVGAFLNGEYYNESNTLIVGDNNTTKFFLFGNLIAEKTGDEIKITNAGYLTNTTKERLNGLPGVSIAVKKGVWYLNGQQWGGEWINIIRAKSHAVNDLILFTNNTRELMELRDEIYTIWTEREYVMSPYAFDELLRESIRQYVNKFGESASTAVKYMGKSERLEYCRIYAENFDNFKPKPNK